MLMSEQRLHRIRSSGHGNDVLHLRTLLWNTWRSLSILDEATASQDDDSVEGESLPGVDFYSKIIYATSRRISF